MESQLNILSESLDRKIEILDRLQQYSEEQERILQSEPVDLEKFDLTVDQKDELINQLSRLDEGFELLYEGLAEELKDQRQKYAGRIKELQQKITQVTEMSVSIEAQERRNKKLVENYFAREREGIKQKRINSHAAFDYYKNMSKSQMPSSQYYDSKQ